MAFGKRAAREEAEAQEAATQSQEGKKRRRSAESAQPTETCERESRRSRKAPEAETEMTPELKEPKEEGKERRERKAITEAKIKDMVEESTVELAEPVNVAGTQCKKAGKGETAGDVAIATSPSAEQADCKRAGDMDPQAFRDKMLIACADGNTELPDPVQRLEAAPFARKVRQALVDAGFTTPTAIQSQAWPLACQGNDLIAVAKTGSGKTLGFLLPGFRMLSKTKPDVSLGPAVVVLAPTRELVMQIEEGTKKFGQVVGVSAVAVYGGVPKPPQAKALRSHPQMVLATPGRLVDLMQDGVAKLGNVKFLVLDEADRMLDMGFEPQMKEIMEQIPDDRQTLLFSATWPKTVKKLAKNYLKASAVRINVGETEELAANKAISQKFFQLSDDEKDAKLWHIISNMDDDAKVIVFANTKRRIDKLQKSVREFSWTSVAMHGDKSQKDRDVGLGDFVSGKAPLMFSTDVCARGLDIKEVTHVINYDMARDVESYVHRIGRTGRAGSTGESITFVNDAFDTECAPALTKIAKEAGQEVPAWLDKLAARAKGGKANKLWKY